MATALQLVNRVRRQLRWGDTASLARDDDKAILDAVNAAVAVIFETWDWECDLRHDGALITFPHTTYTGRDVTASTYSQISSSGSTEYTALADAEVKRASLRVVVTTDANLGDTALRVDYVWYSTFSTTSNAVLDSVGLTAATATAAVEYMANEYALPATVRKVLSVRHQESNVRLEETDQCQTFDRIVQRPHETISDNPELVVVGGMVRMTEDVGSTAGLPTPYTPEYQYGLGFWVYPTPSTSMRLDYSYLVKHEDMAETTDTLANVDRVLEDFVVQLAYARCINNFVGDADPGAGLALEQRVMNMARVYHANQGKDPSRRRVIGSNFCEGFGSPDFGRFPRNFGTGT